MYDFGKVILFLIVFVALVLFPFWYGAAAGSGGEVPDPETPSGECVESKEYMRAWHMDMLDEWRDDAVREADRDYTSSKGIKYKKSLTLTCMDCHENEEKFCGECHDYVGVETYCWDCHIDPKKE